MTPRERRYASILRTRQWHEQRTAAGKCHRCPRKVEEAGWFCRRCAIEISEQKQFVKFVVLAAEKRCVECGGKYSRGRGLAHPRCRRHNVLNTSGYYRRSSDKQTASEGRLWDGE